MPAQVVKVDRRTAIKLLGSTAIGGFMVATSSLTSCSTRVPKGGPSAQWGAWLHIDMTGRIRIYCPRVEMGQGVLTSLGALVADELDAEWSAVSVEHAPVDRTFGSQVTQGSSSVRENYTMLRELGATARAQLVAAAAELWQVSMEACKAQASRVFHPDSGRQASYAELAERAAQLPLGGAVSLKTPSESSLNEQHVARIDVPAMVDGTRQYTGDISIPGMMYATVTHCPHRGGRIESLDSTAARSVTGVVDVLDLGDCIATVGTNTWATLKGQEALQIQWKPPTRPAMDDDDAIRFLRSACEAPGDVAFSRGNAASAGPAESPDAIAEFTVPYDAHATMEPGVCVAHVKAHSCEVWAPTQSPWAVYRQALDHGLSTVDYFLERLAVKLRGRPRRVNVHCMPLGGGFGRRLDADQVGEAVRISRAMKAPVKLLWTREEDLANDFYRPMSIHRLSATLRNNRFIETWRHRAAGAGPLGHATDFPYDCTNVRIETSNHDLGVPTGSWRSTVNTPSAFARECFMDELAVRAGQDPLQFRLQHLTRSPRLQRVLETAARNAGWNNSLPPGHGRGLALHPYADTCVAQVAEVSVIGGEIRVHRIFCTVDCGRVVNPDGVRAQIEGAIVFGLTATLKSAVTFKAGRVEQSNFHDFQLLRLGETPAITVDILPSDEPPGGVGELGVPPVAPAIANAVHVLTGQRLRTLPLRI